jgi:CHAT domain-containing protein/tetratricopeptide (TPR) repeat protein
MGDTESARAAYQRALQIRERALGPDHLQVAVTLLNFAELLIDLGEPHAARAHLTRARAIFDRVAGARQPAHLPCLRALAKLDRREGRLEDSAATLAEALRILDSTPAPPPVQRIRTLAALGELDLLRGRVSSARALLEEAFNLASHHLEEGDPLRPYLLRARGAARWADGQPREALSDWIDSQTLRRESFRLNARVTSEEGAFAYLERRSDLDPILSVLASELRTDPEEIARAWDTVVRTRAIVLDEFVARHATLRGVDGGTLAAARDSTDIARAALARILTAGPSDPGEARAAAVTSARKRLARAEEKLGEESLVFRRVQEGARVGLDEVIASLPEESALVAFVRYIPAEAPADLVQHPPVPHSYGAFVWSPHGAPAFVPLGDEPTLSPLLAAWQETLRPDFVRRAGRSSDDIEQECRSLGFRVRRALWDPIEPAIEPARRIFLVPDGLTNLVDFAALPTADGHYLVEGAAPLHYLTAERDLTRRNPTNGDGLLAIGAPVFGTPTSAERGSASHASGRASRPDTPLECLDASNLRFEELRAAPREIEDVDRLWRESAGRSTGETDVRKGRDATEAALRALAPGKRLLHIASHAFAIADPCGVEEGGDPGADEGSIVRRGPSPLLFGGIALAGANERLAASSTADDGILLTEEVTELDLTDVECVVLSACETGAGLPTSGEGVLGLRRAFQIAGAATVLASLRPVDDAASAAWIKSFYEARFGSGVPIDEAARAASLERLRERRARGLGTHPAFWSGLIATGQWR